MKGGVSKLDLHKIYEIKIGRTLFHLPAQLLLLRKMLLEQLQQSQEVGLVVAGHLEGCRAAGGQHGWCWGGGRQSRWWAGWPGCCRGGGGSWWSCCGWWWWGRDQGRSTIAHSHSTLQRSQTSIISFPNYTGGLPGWKGLTRLQSLLLWEAVVSLCR